MNGLTQREIEVIRLISEGHSFASIARSQHLSVTTVKSRVARIREKMGTPTNIEMMLKAIEEGLIKNPAYCNYGMKGCRISHTEEEGMQWARKFLTSQ